MFLPCSFSPIYYFDVNTGMARKRLVRSGSSADCFLPVLFFNTAHLDLKPWANVLNLEKALRAD